MTSPAKPLVITVGDPAGAGPDLCADALSQKTPAPLVVVGDRELIAERANAIGVSFAADEYRPHIPTQRAVLHCPLDETAVAGELSSAHAPHILRQLKLAAEGCLRGEFSALVTAPVSKRIIAETGAAFLGQTEHLAALSNASHPVMLLAGEKMKVALATRHVPLAKVSDCLNTDDLLKTMQVLDEGLRRWTDGRRPRIAVAGLNPHAGEGGMLGDEEERVIIPAIKAATEQGMLVDGPHAADSMFSFTEADCYLAMYHDQGLPVIKHADFNNTVNITLGLPFLRTSPDHGTAEQLAGTGKVLPHSMRAAVKMAATFGGDSQVSKE